jgi:hypothetical protein
MTDKEARWSDLVRAWRASGMTARAFGRERKISDSSLRWWAAQLEKRTGAAAPAPPRGSSRSSSPSPASIAIARVVRPGEPLPAEDDAMIAVVVGQVRIAVRRGFDPSVLRDVVRALESPR